MIPLTLQEHKDTFNRIDTLFMFGQLRSYGKLLLEIGHSSGELTYVYQDYLDTLNKQVTQKDIQNEKEKYFNYLTYHISFNKMERQSTS